jgi:hypothetical protein
MNVKTKNLIQLRARQAEEAMAVMTRNSIQQMAKEYSTRPRTLELIWVPSGGDELDVPYEDERPKAGVA